MTSHFNEFSSLSSSSSLTSWQALGKRSRGDSFMASSEYEGCSSSGGAASRSFSSGSLDGYSCSSSPPISIKKDLLTPLHLDIDPAFQERRKQEKEEIKNLNNQFASLIGKVQCLEQQNKVLTTRWSFLKDQNNSHSESEIKLLYNQYMSRLKQEMRTVSCEREQLESELTEVLNSMDDIRSSYEDEVHRRSAMEFTFVELKKVLPEPAHVLDLDASSLHKTELEVKLHGLQQLTELKKIVYEQELQELLTEIKDISVNLEIDNRCSLDLSCIVEEVRAQYEALALRSWEDAEAATWSKLSEGTSCSTQYRNQLLSSRREIAELTIRIQKLRSCIVSLESQCLHLEEDIKEAGERGRLVLQDARAKLAELEEALQKSKADLAHMVKEYSQLMNLKLALDVEILTYRKLVEGEESSIESPTPAIVSSIRSRPRHFSSHSGFLGTSTEAARGRGNSTDEVSQAGAVPEAALARSQSSGSGSHEAEVQPGGAGPKPHLLSGAEHRNEESIPVE